MNDNIGIFPGVPFDEYQKIEALNGSSLVHMRRSPMYYRFMCDNPQPPTKAMILGTATHRLILEPHRVGDFAVWGTLPEEKIRNGRVWENFKRLNEGALIVTVAERDAMVGMAVGARKNVPIMKYANAKGQTEVTMVWNDKETGRLMKGRVDKILNNHAICDLKTTRDCRSRKFSAQSYQLGYHIKMAIYWSGYHTITGHMPAMKLLAIESKAPYESAVFRVTPDVILQGAEEKAELLETLANCETANAWPAEHDVETDLTLPTWVTPGGEEDLSEFATEEEVGA